MLLQLLKLLAWNVCMCVSGFLIGSSKLAQAGSHTNMQTTAHVQSSKAKATHNVKCLLYVASSKNNYDNVMLTFVLFLYSVATM